MAVQGTARPVSTDSVRCIIGDILFMRTSMFASGMLPSILFNGF